MNNQPARFGKFLKQAETLVQSPSRLQRLTSQALQKLARQGGDGLRQGQSQLQTAIAMINAWRAGDYDGVATKTIVSLAAAVLYFVVPVDVIPDFLLGWGFIDDIAVMGYVFNQLSEEIEAFRRWQESLSEKNETETTSPHEE